MKPGHPALMVRPERRCILLAASRGHLVEPARRPVSGRRFFPEVGDPPCFHEPVKRWVDGSGAVARDLAQPQPQAGLSDGELVRTSRMSMTTAVSRIFGALMGSRYPMSIIGNQARVGWRALLHWLIADAAGLAPWRFLLELLVRPVAVVRRACSARTLWRCRSPRSIKEAKRLRADRRILMVRIGRPRMHVHVHKVQLWWGIASCWGLFGRWVCCAGRAAAGGRPQGRGRVPRLLAGRTRICRCRIPARVLDLLREVRAEPVDAVQQLPGECGQLRAALGHVSPGHEFTLTRLPGFGESTSSPADCRRRISRDLSSGGSTAEAPELDRGTAGLLWVNDRAPAPRQVVRPLPRRR